jgi:transposase
MKRGTTPEPERSQLLAAAARAGTAGDELRAAVQAARLAGGSVREIAALIGRSTNTVQRWLRSPDDTA